MHCRFIEGSAITLLLEFSAAVIECHCIGVTITVALDYTVNM